MKIKDLKPGRFYHLTSLAETKPLLAHYYYSSDHKTFGFGFNTHDGGGFLKSSDIGKDIDIVEVEIIQKRS